MALPLSAPFVQIQNVDELIPIFKSRFPFDTRVLAETLARIELLIYNMAVMYPKFKDCMKFFTLGTEITSDTWVVSRCEREDYGVDISISEPPGAIFTPEIKDAFSSSQLLDWKEPYVFSAMGPSLATSILDISIHVHGNETTVNPCNVYCTDPSDAMSFEIGPLSDGASLKPLDVDTGADFLHKTWKYSREKTLPYLRKLIERNPSCGITIDDKLVTGVTLNTLGFIGFLYTSEEHRFKNFGKMAMQHLIKVKAQQGFIPCSLVEVHNIQSNSFHEKVGMTFSHCVDFVGVFEKR